MDTEFFLTVIRISLPLVFAALGGYFSEKSGVVQIALEGWMTVGAFSAAVFTILFHQPILAFFMAGTVAGFFCIAFGILVIFLRMDQIVAGTASNLLILGLVPLLGKILYGSTGGTPNLEKEELLLLTPWICCSLIILLTYYLSNKSRWGIRMRFSGEEPLAVTAAGYSVSKVRLQSLWICGFLAGLGGACLSVYLSSGYSRNMVAGRGFMALAALIFGKWKPLPTAISCLLWGFFEALQIYFQNSESWKEIGIPMPAIQLLPYLITIFVLGGLIGRAKAPKFLGR